MGCSPSRQDLQDQIHDLQAKLNYLSRQIEKQQKHPLPITQVKNVNYPHTHSSLIKLGKHSYQEKLKPIQQLQYELSIKNLHTSSVRCFIQLQDKRIATGSTDKSISICSIDFSCNLWKQDFIMKDAHNDTIYCLCQLPSNELISSSSDEMIKIWKFISTNEFILTTTISLHSSIVYKVITLTKQRFASCSMDSSIKIFNAIEPYQLNVSLGDGDGWIKSIIQLKDTEILVASCAWKKAILFWDLDTNECIGNIMGYYVSEAHHMIELSDGNVAISSDTEGYPIVIIDPHQYEIVGTIKLDEYIYCNSALCVFDKFSFVYISGKITLQISSTDYRLLYKSKKEKSLIGYSGCMSINNGEYLVVNNKYLGISVVKPIFH